MDKLKFSMADVDTNLENHRRQHIVVDVIFGDSYELAEASKEHEKQAMAYRQEYISYGESQINGSSGFMDYVNYDQWLAKVTAQKGIVCSSSQTPATTYFMIRKQDSKIIGSIQLRHHLTDELLKDGGNIGYGICPTERGKGYGSLQL